MQTQTSNTLHNAIMKAGSKDRLPMLAPDNNIYSTVDACPNVCEMRKAIERLKQGESINVQDLETNLFWEFGKFTSLDGESLESYYSSFFIISSIAVQTPGSGIFNLLVVGTTFTGSGNNIHWQIHSWSSGSGLYILLSSTHNSISLSLDAGLMLSFFIISSIAVQTPGSGISNLLAVGTSFTGSGYLYCQWELSPGSGNALCILFPTRPRSNL
nr:hypothetical protein [Tanacetum cinerariifolium]